MNPEAIPLSLYIHVPWCIRKCPYCDFNSHENQAPPWESYVQQLINDLNEHTSATKSRNLRSIFFGGGTPSLMPPAFVESILQHAESIIGFEPDIEITLEANPGTLDLGHFAGYRKSGVNRLSIGIQSFNHDHLHKLGRIHSPNQAIDSVKEARAAGFTNLNLDLMHGLPDQAPDQGISDLEQALALNPEHISWYQLTLEPNTAFFRNPPQLPSDNLLGQLEDRGRVLLENAGWSAYEVSAWSKSNNDQSKHNLNYWSFGDYLGIGAGAHGKLTSPEGILRYQRTRQPEHYLNNSGSTLRHPNLLKAKDAQFEGLMNGLRLKEGINIKQLNQRLPAPLDTDALIKKAGEDLLCTSQGQLKCTPLGLKHLDSVLGLLSPD